MSALAVLPSVISQRVFDLARIAGRQAVLRRAKSEGALRGRKLKDLVEEGLRLVLEAPRQSHRSKSLAN